MAEFECVDFWDLPFVPPEQMAVQNGGSSLVCLLVDNHLIAAAKNRNVDSHTG